MITRILEGDPKTKTIEPVRESNYMQNRARLETFIGINLDPRYYSTPTVAMDKMQEHFNLTNIIGRTDIPGIQRDINNLLSFLEPIQNLFDVTFSNSNLMEGANFLFQSLNSTEISAGQKANKAIKLFEVNRNLALYNQNIDEMFTYAMKGNSGIISAGINYGTGMTNLGLKVNFGGSKYKLPGMPMSIMTNGTAGFFTWDTNIRIYKDITLNHFMGAGLDVFIANRLSMGPVGGMVINTPVPGTEKMWLPMFAWNMTLNMKGSVNNSDLNFDYDIDLIRTNLPYNMLIGLGRGSRGPDEILAENPDFDKPQMPVTTNIKLATDLFAGIKGGIRASINWNTGKLLDIGFSLKKKWAEGIYVFADGGTSNWLGITHSFTSNFYLNTGVSINLDFLRMDKSCYEKVGNFKSEVSYESSTNYGGSAIDAKISTFKMY